MFRYISESALYEKHRASWQVEGTLVSVEQLLSRAVKVHGDKVALVAPDRMLTYRQWWYYVLVFATKLRRLGVKPGSRVIVYAQNSCEFYIAYFAIWHVGAIAVPLNTYLHEKEMAGILRDAEPDAIITIDTMVDQMQRARDLAPSIACRQFVFSSDFWDQHQYNRALLCELDESVPSVSRAGNECALILYTSGTTGIPKGVMLSSQNVLTNVLQVMTRFDQTVGISTQERFLSILPLFHVFAQNACMWLPVMLGSLIVIVPRIERRALLQALQQHRPTIFFGFPALYGLLVMMRKAPLNSIKLFVSGADALPDKIRMAFSLVYGRKIASGYGLTEASPVIAVDGSSYNRETSCVGNPLVGVACEVRNEEGTSLSCGEVGTLWVKGDNIMMGYYKAPEETARILHDGWLDTGDLATISSSGLLTIVGRSKDVIINKGFNIYPQEVENVLLRHPAVIKAAVVGIDDQDVGQIPVAYVALKEGASVGQEEISQFCKQHLAAYKVPKTITCLPDLPMNATGKIDKKQLR